MLNAYRPKVNRQEERLEFALVLVVSQTIQISRGRGSGMIGAVLYNVPLVRLSNVCVGSASSGSPLCPHPQAPPAGIWGHMAYC